MRADSEVLISPSDTLRRAMEIIDRNSIQICFVINVDGKLVGALTDGDIRRALLKSARLEDSVDLYMNRNPKSIQDGNSRMEILEKMRLWNIRHLPVLDASGKVLRIETSDHLLGLAKRTNKVVLMAGGFGKRLSPLTDSIPKPLLKVGGQPILETIVKRFRDMGFSDFIFVVNYRAEMIREHFGDGEKIGVRIQYIQEEAPLGTCGGLTLLKERPQEPFFVMNGDILTQANFAAMLDEHISLGSAATMAVREYYIEVPYGVVKVDGHRILSIEEKPKELSYVNAGIYVLSPDAWDLIPKKKFFDMPGLFIALKEHNEEVNCYRLKDYWLDIGRMEDFHKAQSDFEGYFRT
ncbi:MAG TPA: nucleotidyltransferase family protein [Bdellovibrio sp.]|nr:nucleotidyltransferase family protein [Bdellovibrio sp.]